MASGSIQPKKALITKSYTYTGSSGAPGVSWNVSRTNFKMTVPEGYTPFSFTSYYTGSDMIAVSRIQPRNTGTVASFKNVGTGNPVTPTFRLTVTYVPEEMVVDVSGKYSVEIAEASESFGKVVDPTTGLPTDQLFFTPNDTIAFLFDEYDDSDPALTLSSISLSYSNGTSGTITVDPTAFVNGKYFTTMTMPEKSIVATGNYT